MWVINQEIQTAILIPDAPFGHRRTGGPWHWGLLLDMKPLIALPGVSVIVIRAVKRALCLQTGRSDRRRSEVVTSIVEEKVGRGGGREESEEGQEELYEVRKAEGRKGRKGTTYGQN